MATEIAFSGVFTELVNRRRSLGLFDFAYGEYLATKNFFTEISRIQEQINEKDENGKAKKITLNTGQIIDPNESGGAIALNLYMEAVDSLRMAASGLAKAGLSAEKTIWKNL